MKKKNTLKKTAPAVILACMLMFSGCSTRTGEIASNIDTSNGELLSQEDVNNLDGDVVKNIKDYVKNAPSISNMTLSAQYPKFNVEAELNNRKNNFVFCSESDTVLATDKVNLTFIEVVLSSGKATYEINVAYDFDLNSDYDQTFKNGLINKKVGEKVVIEKCKLPDGSEANVKVKINYISRKVDELSALDSLVPEGNSNYALWLESALEKSAKVNDIWSQLINTVTVETNSDVFKDYFNEKYNNAFEYFSAYSDESSAIDVDALKKNIETQCKKEFIAYYYAKEFDVKFGEYREEELKNIALFYGYTPEAFSAKFDESVIKNTVFMDLVGAKILKNLDK